MYVWWWQAPWSPGSRCLMCNICHQHFFLWPFSLWVKQLDAVCACKAICMGKEQLYSSSSSVLGLYVFVHELPHKSIVTDLVSPTVHVWSQHRKVKYWCLSLLQQCVYLCDYLAVMGCCVSVVDMLVPTTVNRTDVIRSWMFCTE